MLGFARFLILVLLAILVAVFSLTNRGPLTLSFDPFQPEAPALSLSAPVFVILFLTLMLGILLGGMAAWIGQAKWRRAARLRAREAASLRAAGERRLSEASAASNPIALRR